MKFFTLTILTSLTLTLFPACHKQSVATTFTICPVCHMKITVANDTPKSVFKGKTFFFDEPEMKSIFDKNPMKYLNADLSINSNKEAEGH